LHQVESIYLQTQCETRPAWYSTAVLLLSLLLVLLFRNCLYKAGEGAVDPIHRKSNAECW